MGLQSNLLFEFNDTIVLGLTIHLRTLLAENKYGEGKSAALVWLGLKADFPTHECLDPSRPH